MIFLKTTLIQGIKCVKHKIVILILVLTMAMMLSQAIVLLMENTFVDDFKFDIAVTNLDESSEMELLMKIILRSSVLNNRFNITTVGDVSTGEQLLRDNQVLAVIILPDGFLNSVLTGQNSPPEIITPKLNSLERYIIEDMVKSLEQVMVETQSAIYVTIDNLREQGKLDSAMILDINIELVVLLMSIFNALEVDGISYTQNLSIEMFYTISIGLFMLFLTTLLFYDDINLSKDISVLKFIKNINNNYRLLYLSKIFVIMLVYYAIFQLINFSLGLQINIFAMLNATILFILVQAVLLNLFQQYIISVYVNSVIHISSLVVCGGLVPSIFLPKAISQLEVISPIYYIRNLLTFNTVEDNLIVVAINIVLLLLLHCVVEFRLKECD